MTKRSVLWLTAAAMIAGGALVEGIAVAAFWRPCAGSMLEGSIWQGYAYHGGFSDQCLATMDSIVMFDLPRAGETASLVQSLSFVAALLLAGAWLAILPTLQLRPRTRVGVALPGLLALAVPIAALSSPAEASIPEVLGVLAELALPLALFLLARAGVDRKLLFRTTVLGLAATSVGLVHQMIEYSLALGLSDANWDAPPGTGLGAAVLGGLTAVVILVGWVRDGRAPQGRGGIREPLSV